jgi:hypothetical protein
MCGIGTYSKYLVSKLPKGSFKIFSPKKDEFLTSDDLDDDFTNEVSFNISLSDPKLPSHLKEDLLWFQHSFGMWGKNSVAFIKLIRQAKQKKK